MKKFPDSISTPTEPGLSLNPGSHESELAPIPGFLASGS
jgi:hypothetical protein